MAAGVVEKVLAGAWLDWAARHLGVVLLLVVGARRVSGMVMEDVVAVRWSRI
jgi:hypothetical protein